MKIKTLQRSSFTNNTTNVNDSNFHEGLSSLKTTVRKKINKDSVQVSFLYILSILSISCWIISIRVLPFGDIFQFLLGAVVLSVNLLVFKYTKI